jgi:predicted lactoylglutathione lyase
MQNTNKQIYINLIVKDLAKATKFYEDIGFVKNPMFSDENASGLAWSENIIVMLLTESFAKNFTEDKEISDNKKSISALYSISMNSRDEVDEFRKKSIKAGARVYDNEYNKQYDFMYGFEMEDLDGYVWEPIYMDMSKFPQA